jgi:hypothetical protein
MGLLDEAIRQHLELKRRHGADPSEVARQEHEALGPPRHGTAAEEAELADPDGLDGDESELHDNGDELLDAEPHPEAEFAPERPAPEALEPEPEPRPEPDSGPLEPTREPEAQAGATSALDQPTQVYDAGDLEATDADAEGAAQPADAQDAGEPARDGHGAGEEPGEASEDVLEETPEFLQETPEHDRLWFEQKPPRDFDF